MHSSPASFVVAVSSVGALKRALESSYPASTAKFTYIVRASTVGDFINKPDEAKGLKEPRERAEKGIFGSQIPQMCS